MSPNEALGGPPSLPSAVRFPEIIPGPIQRFADTGLQSQIDRAVAQLKPGSKGAWVGYERNGTFGTALVAKLPWMGGERWSVGIGIDKPKGQGFSHEGVIKFEW